MTLCEREKCAKCVRAVAAELERLQHDYELLARECSNLTVEFQHAQEKLDEELEEHKITKKQLERRKLLRDAGTAVEQFPQLARYAQPEAATEGCGHCGGSKLRRTLPG